MTWALTPLTEEQLSIQSVARDFALKELAPYTAAWDRDSHFEESLIPKLGELSTKFEERTAQVYQQTALAEVREEYENYFEAINIYVKSQHWGEKPYIGEYLDEKTGAWLKGDNPRSRFYNHSTFCDLVITGLIGLVPRADDTIELSPLLPPGEWDYFCLDNVLYHGRKLTITWDRTGEGYTRGAGLSIAVDGEEIARSPQLQALTTKMP